MTTYEPKNLKNKKFWEEAKAGNTDSYGGSAVAAAAHTMVLLDEGKTPAEAEKAGFHGKDLTGFLAGCAAQMIGQVHERGDEFRKWWNLKYGVTEEQADGGTVNPAIMTRKSS